MPDYSKGKIYKICSDDPDITEVNIGSTTQPLHARFACHKNKFAKNISTYTSRHMFEKYGVDSFHIELLEEYPCSTRKELCIREQYFMDKHTCVNKNRAFTSEEDKKTNLSMYSKIYRIENCDKLAAHAEEKKPAVNLRARERYQENKEEYLAKQKQFRKDNPEHCRERDKAYRETYEEKIKAQKKKSRSTPESKLKVQAYNKAYRESKKHATLMEALSLQKHQAHAPTSE